MSDEGNAPTWSDALPEDVRGWEEVANSDTPEKFWGQMVNMRSRMGTSIRIPSEDAGDEDRAAFYQKLQDKVPGLMVSPDFEDEDSLTDIYSRMGRPTEAKDYVVPEFKNAKGEVVPGMGEALAESFKDTAFKAGMSQKKYAEVLTSLINSSVTRNDEVAQLQLEDKAKLSTEWGAAYDRNSGIVSNFLTQTDAPKSVQDALSAGTVDSATMKWFHKVASTAVGKQGAFQKDDSASGVMTPGEAAIKISEIRNNKTHPYNNRTDPGNSAAKKYMRELYLLKNPERGKDNAPGTQYNIGGAL